MPGSHCDTNSETSEDIDKLFEELESAHDSTNPTGVSDPALAALRETRLNALSKAINHARQQTSQGYGSVTTFYTDTSVLELTTSHSRAVVHFFHPRFQRCKTMDRHLDSLAARHLETRFARVDVEKAPFIVGKLGVRVLPCVIGFRDGIAVAGGRIVGFEGLTLFDLGSRQRENVDAETEDFETAELEAILLAKGIIEGTDEMKKLVAGGTKTARKDETADDDVGDDWE